MAVLGDLWDRASQTLPSSRDSWNICLPHEADPPQAGLTEPSSTRPSARESAGSDRQACCVALGEPIHPSEPQPFSPAGIFLLWLPSLGSRHRTPHISVPVPPAAPRDFSGCEKQTAWGCTREAGQAGRESPPSSPTRPAAQPLPPTGTRVPLSLSFLICKMEVMPVSSQMTSSPGPRQSPASSVSSSQTNRRQGTL